MSHYFPSDEFYLEEHTKNSNRLRLCNYKGECGKWFSKLRHTNSMGYLEVPDFALLKEHNR